MCGNVTINPLWQLIYIPYKRKNEELTSDNLILNFEALPVLWIIWENQSCVYSVEENWFIWLQRTYMFRCKIYCPSLLPQIPSFPVNGIVQYLNNAKGIFYVKSHNCPIFLLYLSSLSPYYSYVLFCECFTLSNCALHYSSEKVH
jgi:hypothetical protein